MAASILPLSLFGVMTYSSTYAILKNKIQSGIQASLNQEGVALENTLTNLDFASKQFALDDKIVAEIQAYLDERDTFKKAQLMDDMQKKVTLVNFTNPYLGLTFYYAPKSAVPVMFESLTVNPDFDPDKLPHFTDYNGASYAGPHRTVYSGGSNIVFSAFRRVTTSDKRELFIYLETNYNLFRKIVNPHAYGMDVSHLLVSQSGDVTYVENEVLADKADEAGLLQALQTQREYKGYMLFQHDSTQGWKLVTLVKKATFNSEIDRWLLKTALFAIATLLFALLLAYLIWRTIYRPMRKLNREIVSMVQNRDTPVQMTKVEEFDFLLQNFQDMKEQINGLIVEVQQNEKRKSQLEIEKLLTQINPHFLHNTLNTVQWLARINGQKDIDKLVSLLVKVLHYNMGKQSLIVSVDEEVEALRNYMELQKIRYDHDFGFTIDVEQGTGQVPIPRFLLQPLVENAIYHGSGEREARIETTVKRLQPGWIRMKIQDNGAGMTEETVVRLMEEDSTTSRGLGIGISYVHRLIKKYFGESAQFLIDSRVGEGTTVMIDIPVKRKEDLDD